MPHIDSFHVLLLQTSAAAFTKAMLDLEGNSLTPILVSLVNKDASMLEAFGKGASDDIAEAKEALYKVGWARGGVRYTGCTQRRCTWGATVTAEVGRVLVVRHAAGS